MIKKILALFLFLLISRCAFAATEDLTTFTEVDTDGTDITVTSTRATWVNGQVPTSPSYVRKSLGAGYFGDFIHLFTTRNEIVGNNEDLGYWAVGDAASSSATLDTSNAGLLFWYTRGADGMWIKDYTNDDTDQYAGTFNSTTFYSRATRTGVTTVVQIYSDSDRTTLVDTLQVDGSSAPTFEYVYALLMLAANQSDNGGYLENLDLGVPAAVITPHVLEDFYGENIYIN